MLSQVRFWRPDSVSVLLALLQLYAVLMQAATRQPLLASTLARLLLRPCFLHLLVGVLQLLHCSEEYRGLCEQHERLSAALQLWEFIKLLVRFGAAHGASVEGERGGMVLMRA